MNPNSAENRNAFFRTCLIAALLLTPRAGNSSSSHLYSATAEQQATATAADQHLPPREWAKAAAANEIVTLRHKDSYLRYWMRVKDNKGDRTRVVMETKDGSVARLILRDGKPITTAEDQAERQRLQAMLNAPQSFLRHIRNQESSKRYVEEIIRQMPDAMIYTYAPGQPQSGNKSSSREVVLDYKPDPAFRPPNTASEALSGIRGRLWIDSASRNLLRVEGEIFRSENFGWGMIAHVDPGGKFLLVQTNAGADRWIFSNFSDQISMRVGLIKPINVNDTIEASKFETVPDSVGYQDAILSLLAIKIPTS